MNINDILSIQSSSGQEWRMFARIVRECTRMGCTIEKDDVGNLYVTKGQADTYPCAVAHMDTVHSMCEDLTLLQVGDLITGFNRVKMKQTGVGGDDKVGVYIALQLLEEEPVMKAAFFVDEERGCVGSGLACMDFFNDCRFVLQADRRGSTDFITNAGGVELCSKAFKRAVRPLLSLYGYKEAQGMMTDVMELKRRKLPVSAINASCGYHRPHCADEYVNVKQVEQCLDLFRAIIERCTRPYKHEYRPAPAPVPAIVPVSYGGYGQGSFDWGSDSTRHKPYYQPRAWRKAEAGAATAPVPITDGGTCEGCERYRVDLALCRYTHLWMCRDCRGYYA